MLYLNGQFLSQSAAGIATDDRGWLLGDGAFETLRCYKGQVFALNEHWQRLLGALQFLGITLDLDVCEVAAIIKRLLIENQRKQQDSCVRITVSRGSGVRGLVPANDVQPTVLITVSPLPSFGGTLTLCVADFPINECSPLRAFKTLNYLEAIVAARQAKAKGYDDAIFLNTRSQVVGTTIGNIFIVENDVLFTPPCSVGCLPGITRQWIIQIAGKLGVVCKEQNISFKQLQAADEVFVCNSLREIQAVSKINERQTNCRQLHLITNKIHKAYQVHVNKFG